MSTMGQIGGREHLRWTVGAQSSIKVGIVCVVPYDCRTVCKSVATTTTMGAGIHTIDAVLWLAEAAIVATEGELPGSNPVVEVFGAPTAFHRKTSSHDVAQIEL